LWRAVPSRWSAIQFEVLVHRHRLPLRPNPRDKEVIPSSQLNSDAIRAD
jgi:hypothetical protein